MANYDGLKPGLYLQVGDSIKALKSDREYLGSFTDFLYGTSERNPSAEKLAASVSWVWIALQRRRQMLSEIEYVWQFRKQDAEQAPFNMRFGELLAQIDESLQLYSQAYLFKRRADSGQVVGVRWLDPTTIRPDYEHATPEDGIKTYIRSLAAGQEIKLRAEDVLHFRIPGMRELKPGVPAAGATALAAQVLRGISQVYDTFYENNALPVMLIKVPSGTPETELTRIQSAFKRMFNTGKGSREIRTQGVRADVEIEPLSFKPNELETGPLEMSQIDAILAAHDVPKSIALSNSATYATDVAAARRFVSALGARLDDIAEVFNTDRDFMAVGHFLDVRTQFHFSMKEDEQAKATAFKTYVDGRFTPEAAAHLVGINLDDFPAGIEVFEEKPEPQPVPPQLQAFQQDQQQPPEPPDAERMAEEKAFRNWLKKRANPDPAQFEAYHLTEDEKQMILWQVKGTTTSTADMATGDDVAKAVRAFQHWADEHAPELAYTLNLEVDDA